MKRYIKSSTFQRYTTNVSFNFEHCGDYDRRKIEEGIQKLMQKLESEDPEFEIEFDNHVEFGRSYRSE